MAKRRAEIGNIWHVYLNWPPSQALCVNPSTSLKSNRRYAPNTTLFWALSRHVMFKYIYHWARPPANGVVTLIIYNISFDRAEIIVSEKPPPLTAHTEHTRIRHRGGFGLVLRTPPNIQAIAPTARPVGSFS